MNWSAIASGFTFGLAAGLAMMYARGIGLSIFEELLRVAWVLAFVGLFWLLGYLTRDGQK